MKPINLENPSNVFLHILTGSKKHEEEVNDLVSKREALLESHESLVAYEATKNMRCI